MKLKLLVLPLFSLLVTNPLFATEKTVKFAVAGMFCASCPYIVEAAIGEVQGVISVTADASTGTALVVFDDEITTPDEIAGASAAAGYQAALLSGQS